MQLKKFFVAILENMRETRLLCQLRLAEALIAAKFYVRFYQLQMLKKLGPDCDSRERNRMRRQCTLIALLSYENSKEKYTKRKEMCDEMHEGGQAGQ